MRKPMDITSNFSKEQLLNMFLSFYDTDYWITKIRTLQLLIEDEELLKKVSQDEVLKKFDKEKLKRSYQYELHMASYHSSEALFGLIFAFLFQKETPWVYLTEYRFDEFNKLVGDIKERGFASIIKEDEIPKFIGWLFFPGVSKENFSEYEKIEKSISFIESYLKSVARTLSDKKDYNSYKHGFRGLPIKSVITIQKQEANIPPLESSGESSLYLDFDIETKNGTPNKRLKIVTKTYSYKTALNIIATNTQMIKNIVESRKHIIVDKATQVNFALFFDKEIKDIFHTELKDKPFHISKFQIK